MARWRFALETALASKRAKWGITITVIAVTSIAGWLRFRQPEFGDRVYRIGWTTSSPVQVRGADGNPTGLAVDLVREAARRRGIKLQWSYWPGSSESALRNKIVDLWPIITIIPERLKYFHITEPYLESEYAFLVRDDSRFKTVKDLASASVGIANPPIDAVQLHSHLPGTHPVWQPTPRAIIADVCEQRTDAALMDAYTTIAALLDTSGCNGHKLRWIAAPEMHPRLGIGSQFEYRAVADAIREEIGVMAGEGKLQPVLQQWGYMTGQSLASIQALLDVRRRATRLAAAASLFALLLLLAIWQTFRLVRERNRTRQTERALRQAEQKLRLMTNNLKEMVLAYDMDRKLIFANPAVETLTGYSASDLEREDFVNWIHPDDQPKMFAFWDIIFQGGSYQEEAYRLVTKDGQVKWASATWGPLLDESGRQVGVQGTERDITEHRALQEQYLQAQKLESVGRLAGGVAHDFNNLLTVINGYSDIVYRRLSEVDPLRASMDEIRKAGERAADLTQQLLTFSRKQVTQPRPLDLNKLVNDSVLLFRRLLGEDIELVTLLNPSLRIVMADPGQIHQVLMNLAVNARDAMPNGGRLVIETSNVDIDASYAAGHPEVTVGPCILLAVSDTGEGMSEATRAHIFEPFFTTKETGKGTGLGLSTVYGIVKQSRGWIWVYSELGSGTTFKIYLPASDAPMPAAHDTGSGVFEFRGSETVLVVEDQPEVRHLAVALLKDRGYHVLDAADGDEALALVDRYPSTIDLLVTDVILPGMNGKELAGRVKSLRPEIKVLYTSGYTGDVLTHLGVLASGVAYLAKPYTLEGFASSVRSVLSPPSY